VRGSDAEAIISIVILLKEAKGSVPHMLAGDNRAPGSIGDVAKMGGIREMKTMAGVKWLINRKKRQIHRPEIFEWSVEAEISPIGGDQVSITVCSTAKGDYELPRVSNNLIRDVRWNKVELSQVKENGNQKDIKDSDPLMDIRSLEERGQRGNPFLILVISFLKDPIGVHLATHPNTEVFG
jgi:hypothetical protein